ncbi:MAG TPA: hypothetical protein VF774_10485 [Pseudoduganella sp.]|jgi:hypothetical protein
MFHRSKKKGGLRRPSFYNPISLAQAASQHFQAAFNAAAAAVCRSVSGRRTGQQGEGNGGLDQF